MFVGGGRGEWGGGRGEGGGGLGGGGLGNWGEIFNNSPCDS